MKHHSKKLVLENKKKCDDLYGTKKRVNDSHFKFSSSWYLINASLTLTTTGMSRVRFRKPAKNTRKGPSTPQVLDERQILAQKFEKLKECDNLDATLGFSRYEQGPAKEGWLVNMHPTLIEDPDYIGGKAGVDFYFIQDDGGMFKSTLTYEPYFYLCCKPGTEAAVEEWLLRRYEGTIYRIERAHKDDLKSPNHLLSLPKAYLQLKFRNVQDLLTIRREVLPLAQQNAERRSAVDAYADVVATAEQDVTIEEEQNARSKEDPSQLIIDAREYDVPYYLRVATDLGIRVGLWYTVTGNEGKVKMDKIPDRVKRAEPVVMAYDIETCKAPLKFPDSAVDPIMMISYMIDGQGYLITNREIVSEDIEDFDYTPKEEYEGPFTIFNEPDEAGVLKRFFEHIREAKPTVMATYNGDFFDFPYVDARATANGLSLYAETGFQRDNEDEYKSATCSHMDCFRWVKRDSYLPQGSHGLKAVTVAKLGYNPIELDPELMTPYAIEQPQVLAQYSVSDAVATYYLYMKYIHPSFVFSLCNIIPLNPDDVLRKGSGTLCETLLMVEAYSAGVIMPNRHVDPHGSMYEGHLLSSETYVGGHVEALEAGVFRNDIPTDFKIVPKAIQQLIDDLDNALKFSIVVEEKKKLEDIENYDEVKNEIKVVLENLRDNPNRQDPPLIYHLDVAAMYPNIMLSNRLQPDAVVDEGMCAACDYNTPGKQCDRRLTWAWRGEFFPAKRDEYNMIRHALESESFPGKYPGASKRRFIELSTTEQSALMHKRLGDYSRKVYRKTHDTKIINREAIICQRENPFYIDTVRAFRDRRYEYKGFHKQWKGKLDSANESGSLSASVEAKKMIILYDSLQLAHKCILNSFYGYVMRKGARWYSMEMAGITCLTGATIIQMARQLVEQIGRPLELDTDGIWCMLPGCFPENFKFKLKNGKTMGFSYPCVMLNHLVHDKFTNDQYHTLTNKEKGEYEVHSENSIFFELDGPYRAMILPASKEEDKLLKKRYAVFEEDGSLAELKGFEVKRRGELQLIKFFQSEIFSKFLLGKTTKECYDAVAKVADQWLDILFGKGVTLSDEELVELISENRSMSKTLAEYEGQKSTSISTARRLAEFLGEQMVKDKGLSCRYIISAKPIGAPVTERAVPVTIFTAEQSIKSHYLRKWLKDNSLTDFDIRSILDWDYYIERFGSVVQKIITIPAALQKIPNPVPRIQHPDWLYKRIANSDDKFRQHKLTDMFEKQREINQDMEDLGVGSSVPGRPKQAVVRKKNRQQTEEEELSKIMEIPVPDPDEDYSAFIKVMRKRWKAQRAFKRRHGSKASRNEAGVSRQTALGMFQDHSLGFSGSSWDIVQVYPSVRPGEFRLWLSLGGNFQQVRLRIPREFYLNLKSVPDEGVFAEEYLVEKVIRTLPRDQPCLNLFKLTVPERLYIDNESHFKNLTSNINVDSVYEMQVPLIDRALMKLGSKCALSKSSGGGLSKGLDRGFDLMDLSSASQPTAGRNYLQNFNQSRYIYIFHANVDKRHIFGVFTSEQGCKIFIVDSTNRTRPQLPNLEKVYGQTYDNYINRKSDDFEEAFEYSSEMEFDITFHGSEQSAVKNMFRHLNGLGGQRHGPTIAILNSPQSQSYFSQFGDGLNNYPVIAVPTSRKDLSVDESLMWLPKISKRMIGMYFRMSTWINERVGLAKHYDVPVGNIERDAPIQLADISFARRLIKSDILLWWSHSSKPDLGGREQDVPPQQFADEGGGPIEFSNPGTFSNVVLEVELRDIAVNSILQSSLVNEMEGAGSAATVFDSTSHTIDEYTKGQAKALVTLGEAVVSSQVFSILKSMVKSWYLDKARSADGQNAFGHLLVDHLLRWISSPVSRLFDPGIHRFLRGLMKKVFLQLLAEIKRLGSGIVYADFGRIFILTSKPTAGSAAAYAQYVLSATTSAELFKHISLNTVNFWDYLVFMDLSNFGGVINHNPSSAEAPEEFHVDMKWNIPQYLPTALQTYFDVVIAEYIYAMYSEKRKLGLQYRTPLRAIAKEGGELAVDEYKKQEIEFERSLITRIMTRRLLKIVTDMSKKQTEAATELASGVEDNEEANMFIFPLLPGSQTNMKNPTLEFVKSTCAVLALSKDVAIEVTILKRNLLDVLKVREFSEDAQFKPPCESFKVTGVVCKACTFVQDLDLVRDVELLDDDWPCASCGRSQDKMEVELTLLGMVDKLVASFAVQDLKCAKCGSITDEADIVSESSDLAPHCHCSGAWKLTTSREMFKRRMEVINSIARYHELKMLEEHTESIMT
ncbi:putative DNA polymerase epsilon catalytic subunit A [Wallemia mellicola]|nr:putative DNA polymerase epsilon catalytic subunit A [Wallemia mellicola]